MIGKDGETLALLRCITLVDLFRDSPCRWRSIASSSFSNVQLLCWFSEYLLVEESGLWINHVRAPTLGSKATQGAGTGLGS